MKTILKFILIVITLNAGAQNDTIFPNISASWSVKTYTYDIEGDLYGDYQAYILDDSIVYNGKTWSHVMSSATDTVGIIAIDSGLVYYKSVDIMGFGLGHTYYDTTIQVLYNFNLEIGDTAYVDPYDTYNYAIVDSFSTSNILGASRKCIYFSNEDIWVYGLGSVSGLFRPFMTVFELGISLCSFEGNYTDSLNSDYTLTYDDPPTCMLNVQKEEKYQFNVYPNPANSYISISSEIINQPIHITDINGKIVYEVMVEDFKQQIFIGDIAPGIYFIHLGHQFQKLIVE